MDNNLRKELTEVIAEMGNEEAVTLVRRQREQRQRCWVRVTELLKTIRPSASSNHHHYKYHPKKWALGYLCFAFMSRTAAQRERVVCLLSLYSHYANKV